MCEGGKRHGKARKFVRKNDMGGVMCTFFAIHRAMKG